VRVLDVLALFVFLSITQWFLSSKTWFQSELRFIIYLCGPKLKGKIQPNHILNHFKNY
jgi:hypothetical protein